MLLSIDRVLQLLAEGKSIEKIAELASCESSDVIHVIEEARNIITKYEKPISKKKIIIKKNMELFDDSDNIKKGNNELNLENIFTGAELSAVPLGSTLTMYIDGASKGNPGPAGIGIVILDKEDRQVGKVSSYIGQNTNNFAEYTALIRALKIAIYFKTKVLKIRTDSELIVKQLLGEYKVKNPTIKKLYDEAVSYKKLINNFKIEHIPRNFNDKADYLAKKATL